MSSFDIVHRDRVVGNLCMFDRMIFKGHLTRLYPPSAFGAFLTRQGVLFKDFKPYVQAQTATLKAHAQRLAADAGRPVCVVAVVHDAAAGPFQGGSGP